MVDPFKMIEYFRKVKGWTQDKLAIKAGFEHQGIYSSMKSRKSINIEKLCRIAEALEVPPASLITEDEQIALINIHLVKLSPKEKQWLLQFLMGAKPVLWNFKLSRNKGENDK